MENEDNIFRFTTHYGYISINVNNYFVKALWQDIKKLLNIGQKWNTEQNRADFIEKLKNAKQHWEDSRNYYFRNTKKQRLARCDKFQKIIDMVSDMEWGETI